MSLVKNYKIKKNKNNKKTLNSADFLNPYEKLDR